MFALVASQLPAPQTRKVYTHSERALINFKEQNTHVRKYIK